MNKNRLMRLEPDFIEKIEKLYKAGNSIENCAFELGSTFLQCKRALEQAGVPLRTRAESVRANKYVRGVCRQTSARSDFA